MIRYLTSPPVTLECVKKKTSHQYYLLTDFQSSMCKSYQGLNELSCDVENELETFMKLYVLLYADDTVVLRGFSK